MAGIFGGNDYAGGGQAAYNQQQPNYDYGYLGPSGLGDAYTGAMGGDYGGGGDPYGAGDYGGVAAGGGYDYGGGGTTAGGGGILDWLGSEKGERALQQLGGFSAGLLQGSGPSLQPRNFYSALGTGMQGMQQAGSQYYTDALRRAQAQEAQAKVANLGVWDQTLQNEAKNVTGLPPGYQPSSGSTTPSGGAPAAGAGYGGAATGGGQGGWGPLAQPAIGALSAAGLSPAAQQAVMGHGLAEGGFNVPWNVGDSGNSFGHWQFNKGGELPGYMAWAQGKGDPQDTALQAQYVAKRMEDIHPGFSKITDPAQAMAMVADFERYKGYQTNKRLGYLADAQKAMGGGESAPRMPIPGSLADRFQMPSNMAAGLLPRAAPAPAATLGGAPVTPAPLLAAPAPAATARAEAPSAVYEGAGNVASIDRNLENNPNYYRDKVVVLTPVGAGAKLDKLPDQIASVKEAGGQPVLQAGSNPKQNVRMAQIAVKEGVPYHERGEGSGQSAIPAAQISTGAFTPGAGGDSTATPAPVVGAPPAVAPAATAPPPAPAPAAAGPLAVGGDLQLPPGGAPAAPADAGPVLRTGTAPGVPQPPLPAAPAPPPPMPGAVTGGPPSAPIPGATAGARPPVPMPSVIQAQPLPPPNLPQPGSAGVPGLPSYDVNAARRAQVLALAGAATGHQVPAYLADQANLPNKALAQQWEMQKTLYGAQLTAVSDQWKAANDAQKEAIAAQNGLNKEEFASRLRTQENEWDKGRMIGPDGRVVLRLGFTQAESEKAGAIKGAELAPQLSYDVLKDYNTIRKVDYVDQGGTPRTRYASQAQMDAEQGRPPPPAVAATGQPPPGGGAAPPPGGTVAPGAAPGVPTGLSPAQTGRIEIDKGLATSAAQQYAQGQQLRPLLDQVIDMANKTPAGHAVPVTRFVAQALSSFGIPVSEKMSNAEVMQAISQQLIPTVRQPGAQSNKEMDNYLATVPGITQSPAGRIQLAMMNKAMIDRAGEIASIRRNNLGADDLDEKLATLDNKPLFTPVQHAVMVAAQSGPGRPIDAKTYEALPSGMPFYDASGRHIKP